MGIRILKLYFSKWIAGCLMGVRGEDHVVRPRVCGERGMAGDVFLALTWLKKGPTLCLYCFNIQFVSMHIIFLFLLLVRKWLAGTG